MTTAIVSLTFGLGLGLSEDEAATPPMDAAYFDKLGIRRMQAFALKAGPPSPPPLAPKLTHRRVAGCWRSAAATSARWVSM